MDRRRQASIISQTNFADIAPRLRRSRRIVMFCTASRQFLYGAAKLAFLVLLGVGLIAHFGGIGQPIASLPQRDIWTTKADMPTRRNFLSASVIDGVIYVIGGTRPSPSPIEVYDPGTDTWTSKANLPIRRFWLSTSTVNGRNYAIGGRTGTGLDALATVGEYTS